MKNVAIKLKVESESYNCFNSTEFRHQESSEAWSATEIPTRAELQEQKLAVRQRRAKEVK